MSLRLAPSIVQPVGTPWRSEATDHFQPNFPRSVGLGPVPSPVLDVQLTPGYSMTGDLDALDEHASRAATLARQLGLDAVLSVALHFRGTLAALRGDAEGVREAVEAAVAAAPEHRQSAGLVRLECEGLLALVGENRTAAHAAMEAGAAILRESPSSSPSSARGLWPLLLSVEGDPGARDATTLDSCIPSSKPTSHQHPSRCVTP